MDILPNIFGGKPFKKVAVSDNWNPLPGEECICCGWLDDELLGFGLSLSDEHPAFGEFYKWKND